MLRRCTRSQQTKGSSPSTEGGRLRSLVGEVDPRAAAVNICPGIPRARRVRRHPPPRFPYNAIPFPTGMGYISFPFSFLFFSRLLDLSDLLRFTADTRIPAS